MSETINQKLMVGWKVGGKFGERVEIRDPVGDEYPCGLVVAWLTHPSEDPEDRKDLRTIQAQSQLIAAAPRLLEALRDALKALVSEYNKLCDDTWPSYAHPYLPILKSKIEKAETAIAKAEGKGL